MHNSIEETNRKKERRKETTGDLQLTGHFHKKRIQKLYTSFLLYYFLDLGKTKTHKQ